MKQSDKASKGALIRFCGLLSLATILVTACGKEQPAAPEETVTYNVDSSRISVSGLSAGAMMATQLHIAHSSLFNGVALLSGGPWYCAQGSMQRGLGPCMKGGDIGVAQLIASAKQAEADGAIDSLANLTDDRAWIFHATLDEAVAEPVSQAALAFYTEFMPRESIKYVGDIEAAHGFPTLETGVTCNEMASPYLNACNFDAAGKLLAALYGELELGVAAAGELKEVSQPGADDATMLDHAFLYVPESCADGGVCGLHVALHGCLQSAEHIGDAFAAGAGYNEWAEANRLLVLYPQVASSRIAPLNPMGCWDWWGYTEDSYATKAGPQVKVIRATMDALAGRSL
jgi:poly(3-hydroxybutyrate) depolymerase